jgi:hypothetical protein
MVNDPTKRDGAVCSRPYCVHPRDPDATNGQGDEAAIEETKKSGSHRGRERRRGVEGAVRWYTYPDSWKIVCRLVPRVPRIRLGSARVGERVR